MVTMSWAALALTIVVFMLLGMLFAAGVALLTQKFLRQGVLTELDAELRRQDGAEEIAETAGQLISEIDEEEWNDIRPRPRT